MLLPAELPQCPESQLEVPSTVLDDLLLKVVEVREVF
jgi:hypothetical protein